MPSAAIRSHNAKGGLAPLPLRPRRLVITLGEFDSPLRPACSLWSQHSHSHTLATAVPFRKEQYLTVTYMSNALSSNYAFEPIVADKVPGCGEFVRDSSALSPFDSYLTRSAVADGAALVDARCASSLSARKQSYASGR